MPLPLVAPASSMPWGPWVPLKYKAKNATKVKNNKIKKKLTLNDWLILHDQMRDYGTWGI